MSLFKFTPNYINFEFQIPCNLTAPIISKHNNFDGFRTNTEKAPCYFNVGSFPNFICKLKVAQHLKEYTHDIHSI